MDDNAIERGSPAMLFVCGEAAFVVRAYKSVTFPVTCPHLPEPEVVFKSGLSNSLYSLFIFIKRRTISLAFIEV